jgi:hypothetical protein
VEERVLEEDGGSEAHGDEASVQSAGARKRPASAARTQRVGERLRHLHVGGGSGRRPMGTLGACGAAEEKPDSHDSAH